LVEVVPHLLVRHGQHRAVDRGVRDVAGLGQRGEQVRGVAVALVQEHEGTGERGVRADEVDHLGGRDLGGELRVGERLGDRRDEPGVRIRGEERGVHAVDLGDLHQDPGGDGAGVLLELVEVRRRQAERLREGGLGQAVLLAQSAESRSHM